MNYDEAMKIENVKFGDMPPQSFLLGLLSAFDNRYQAAADAYFKEITWKQFLKISRAIRQKFQIRLFSF